MTGRIKKGWKELKAEIVDTDKCCLCGACVNFCDNLTMSPSGPVEQGMLCSEQSTCKDGCGTCYNVCLYTGTGDIPVALLDKWVHEMPSRDPDNEFAHDLTVVAARYAGPQTEAKLSGGGAEAGLLIAALRARIIDGVVTSHVVTDGTSVVDTEGGILNVAHATAFANAPLSGISAALGAGYEALAVVGSGCEIQALRKLQNHPGVDLEVHDLVALAIGSFCFFKPKPSRLETFLKSMGVERTSVSRIGHDKNAFKYSLEVNGRKLVVPVNELYDQCAKGSCPSCADGTAGLADISVGVIDALPGWSVVVVRTARGMQVYREALRLGIMEVQELNSVVKANVLEVTRNKLSFAPIVAIKDEGIDLKTFTFSAPTISRDYKPGQFVVLWLPDVDFFPMGIAHVSGERIEITVQRVGEGTGALFQKGVGEKVGIRGPYGNGWDLAGNDYLAVGGGVGIAGLSSAIDDLVARKKRVTIIFAGRTNDHLLCKDAYDGKVKQACIMTDDGSAGEKGFATDPVEKLVKENGIKNIITCGPEVMMKHVADIGRALAVPVQASLERKMKCCVGICGTCCVGENNDVATCKIGPVFGHDALARLPGFGTYSRR